MSFIHFSCIDSTNTYLKNNYSVLDDLSLVSADIQTAGHGRLNRKWQGDTNNLYFSILIKDQELIKAYKKVSIVSAYAVTKVLNKYGLDNVKIKWPNDVYVNNKKICGILLESVTQNCVECLIVGIGLNVNQREFIGEYLVEPTSLIRELNKETDINILKNDLYDELIKCFKLIKDEYDFFEEINSLDCLKDKDVYALIDNEKKFVKVMGINEDYSLKLKCDDIYINMEAGEISFHI